MVTLLKNLTKLKSPKDLNGEEKVRKAPNESESYYDKGHSMAKKCSGNILVLKTSLDTIYQAFENKCKEDKIAQQHLKHTYVTEQKGKKTALLNEEEEVGRRYNVMEETNKEIDELRKHCRRVITNPEDYLPYVDKKASAKFWIGISFLIPLAVYIFIFYISTSFSAFFREFDPGISLFQGMFDPQALSKAYNAGTLELGFVLLIPFVFFALGYLIHMFQEKKSLANKLKIAALFIITFLFDAILAYLIDEKLYNLNKTFNSE